MTTNRYKTGNATTWVVAILAASGFLIICAAVGMRLTYPFFTMPSESMEPTVLKGSLFVASRPAYNNAAPQRGDIVVFKLPRDGRTDYIKRLIGLPGDRIQLTGGVLSLNGKQIPRVDLGPTQDPGLPSMTVRQFKETQPNGKTYITFDQSPDHEGDTTDVYVVPQGHYFFMGDSRDNSLDSRWPTETGVGFVPKANLVGKVVWISGAPKP